MIRKFSVLLLLSSMALLPAPLLSQDDEPFTDQSEDQSDQQREDSGLESRELTGFLGERSVEEDPENATPLVGEAGEDGRAPSAPPFAKLPIIDAALAQKIDQAQLSKSPADEIIRVIIYLDYLPHAAVLRDAVNARKVNIEALERDRQALMGDLASRRLPDTATDAESYTTMFDLSSADQQALRGLSERNEALSAEIKQQTSAELKSLIGAYQAPVIASIESMGGTVEFTTIAGNTIVASVPIFIVEQLATVAGVLRVVEDSLMEGHLNNADHATMVNPADGGLLGLWDNGQDGGVYDPAIIDSGVDQSHPAMADSAAPSRSNFCSWYLVAGNGSANFGDSFTCDDLQGHGTHVAGIVGSYGSSGFTANLGMAFGVEKMVNLKAGWLNTSTGGASMFWSDKFNLVDRALFNNDQLQPGSSFLDDVDGFNLSYGGTTTLDDTDGGRFWDSVISSIADTPVTISAGNSGPSNANFNDPAVSYNAIVVANYNDRGTSSRTDDIINAGSTVGPTANGRRKPDIAAPGTSISAPRHTWEGGNTDFVNKTGTSMAAPMVLGVIMDLMDAAVFDELALKALLINTAQKNLSGMNIESDFDGWDPQLGWGAMNAFAAYFHRFDIFQDSVNPRDTGNSNTAGDYQLYKGSMRDEGSSGEGRDRVTMVWNRVATYLTAAAPATYYSLVDLNLRLYGESNNALIDLDTTSNDNVHQVRIGAGASDTDVIVNAYAWSTAFAHGGATESFALATEDGFTRVDFPKTFQGIAIWPTSVEPNQVFTIEFWLRNDSTIASHNNSFNLELPAGWTLVSGVDTINVGSAAAGGFTAHHTWTLRAPPAPAVGAQNIVVKHDHSSYNESYGSFNWNINTTVEFDNTPPNPNPMTFSTLPSNQSVSQISMTASFASDAAHPPVDYYLDYTSSPSGGVGGNDSGWQASRSYIDLGLQTNDEYCYRAWARDSASFSNLTTPSAIDCTYTSQSVPSGVSFGAVTNTSIQVSSSSLPANLGLGSSGLLVRNATTGANSGWKQNNNLWTSIGLVPATAYNFNAQARNGDGDLTGNSPSGSKHTLANAPAVGSLTTVSDSEISVVLNPNGNGTQAEYFVENTTAGTNSGWIGSTTWNSTGLSCNTLHNFQSRARNGEGVETIIVPMGQKTTGACVDSDGDGVGDAVDNCILVPNPTQCDGDGDNYGNHCDADFNGDLIVNGLDIGPLKAGFGTANPVTDLNCDGITNGLDIGPFKAMFGNAPGPSGLVP